MDYKPQLYRFTIKDTRKLSELGFQLFNIGNPSFEAFMQRHFPNFNLVALLEIVDGQLHNTTTNIISKKIHYNDERRILKIDYRKKFANEDDALLFVREFLNQNDFIEVKHEYFVIPKERKDNGLMQPVFRKHHIY